MTERTRAADTVEVGAPGDRRRLFAIAYRMLGSVHDAEDAVQEAMLRWQRLAPHDRASIANPAAWLTTVVGRVCLDLLGSARARREQYAGVWLPEPVPGRSGTVPQTTSAGRGSAEDPADVITLEESVSVAMLVVMEQLTPAERVSFILHDLFGVPFDEIAETVGRSPQACRQLASTARRHLHGARRYSADGPERDRVVRAFLQACLSGDLDGLLAVLDPRVVVRSDGGGRVTAASRPVVGADPAARFLLGIAGKSMSASWVREYGHGSPSIEVCPVNGQTGVVVRVGDRAAVIMALAVAGGRVEAVDLVVNPDKLAAWRRTPQEPDPPVEGAGGAGAGGDVR